MFGRNVHTAQEPQTHHQSFACLRLRIQFFFKLAAGPFSGSLGEARPTR